MQTETFYLVIVVFLLVLAVFDLFVGVSNDAVNFLNSAIGAKVAKFRTIMIVASLGVVIGAVMSAGMMDVARHGIMHPVNFSFNEVMTIFLAVMVTDVIVLDVFNTLGMPTSTTVSLVFELLGATFVLAVIKIAANPDFTMGDLLNSDKALSVILAIFVSVAIAFVFGIVVMWLARLIFTFSYKKRQKYFVAVFGGIAFTVLAYFIFIKGLVDSPFMGEATKAWINEHTPMLMGVTFAASTVLMEILYLLKVNVFKIVVLLGTFALAMAFAGNDLVNFIGVPLAGLDSYQDYVANGAGNPDMFMMESLMSSAKTPFWFLFGAGIIMIIAMTTSKKAQNVIKTSVDLSRQDEGEEMFGTSRAARSIVRFTTESNSFFARFVPKKVSQWVDSRFNKEDAELPNGAAFDVVRAAVNLVLASVLIIIGTTYKLPLSTTYVTFMVAMGTSLADRAWSRESAVFRVTGVLSVIGGWFITAGVAFLACCLVCLLMHYGGFVVMTLFIALVIFLIVRSQMSFLKKSKVEKIDEIFQQIMATKDKEEVLGLLVKHVSLTHSYVDRLALEQYDNIINGLTQSSHRKLVRAERALKNEKSDLKKYRRKELIALRRSPVNVAIERNTWYHLGVNSDSQMVYCLRRMLEPVQEHVDNNFNPLPDDLVNEYEPFREQISGILSEAEVMVRTGDFERYDDLLTTAEKLKNELSDIRKQHYDRMQNDSDSANIQIFLVYLNILQESQEFLSIIRHQLRAAKYFYGNKQL